MDLLCNDLCIQVVAAAAAAAANIALEEGGSRKGMVSTNKWDLLPADAITDQPSTLHRWRCHNPR